MNTQVGCSEMLHPWWKAGGPNSGHTRGAQGADFNMVKNNRVQAEGNRKVKRMAHLEISK